MNLNSEAIMKNDVEIAINNVSVVFKIIRATMLRHSTMWILIFTRENSFHFSDLPVAVKQPF